MSPLSPFTEIIDEITIQKALEYTFRYKGITCEIREWYCGNTLIWNYYIYIRKDMLDEKSCPIFFLDKATYFEEKGGYWNYCHLDKHIWFHGGITYYKKLRNSKDEITAVKLGCDYDHSIDIGATYTIEDIVRDCKHTVKSLLNNFDLKLEGNK